LLIVVKEFPILAKSSILAAKAALAAKEQGRFAEYHNALMTSVGGSITQDSLQSIATMVGLDLSLYNEAISSNRFDKILQRNMDAGRAIGIEGTPALLIGEQIIPGAIGLAEINALIKAEREKS